MQDSQLRGTANVVSNGGIVMLMELVGLMVLHISDRYTVITISSTT